MTNLALWGTIVNAVAVLLGALIGLLLRVLMHKASAKRGQAGMTAVKEGDTPAEAVQHGLGLVIVLIGLQGALEVGDVLVMILSIVLGALIGHLLDLDRYVRRLGDFVERKIKSKGGRVSEAFVSATLLFCVGAMTVTGALESGLLRVHTTYYAKAMLDAVAASIFALSLGFGVIFSSLSVFAVQGTLTLLAVLAADAISMTVVGEMIAVGSLLVFAIGLNLLGLTKLKVMNFVPAMFFPLLLCPLFELL